MANPYSVVPVHETPASERRAGESAYDARLGGEIFVPGIRQLVEESWKRSLQLHLDPEHLTPGFDLSDEQLREYRREHPLALVLPVIHRLLIQHTFDTGLIIAVGDQSGRLLWIDGDRDLRRKAESMLFVEGANWSESTVGTSAPGTALALDHGIQIGGPEHFNRIVHPWSCTAVPVHDPSTGGILGVVDITGGDSAVLPTTLPLLEAAVAAAEAELRIHQLTSGLLPGASSSATTVILSPARTPVQSTRPPAGRAPMPATVRPTVRPPQAPDALQLNVLGSEVARIGTEPRASEPGAQYTTELSARHSEILTLLAWHRRGLTAEQLAQKVYGSDTQVTTLRAEMVRLRTVLADLGMPVQIESRPYRLAGTVDLDAHRVLAFLERGAHRVALAAYAGPVLLASTAPGIVDMRSDVSRAVREALLTDASVDVLLDYARTDECVYDREVWVECLRRLPAKSPKRASVVARIERIDAELGRA